MRQERKKLGGLDCLLVGDLDPNKPTVIIAHGYGASENDFAPIVPYLQQAPIYNWIFPRAPVSVDLGWGQQGYAWYPLRFEDFQRKMQSREPLHLNQEEEAVFSESRQKIYALLDDLELQTQNTLLCGFSQGSVVAVDSVLRANKAFLGLGIFSGTFLSGAGWEDLAKDKQETPFFQSHGDSDPVLPFDFAEKLYQCLSSAGMHGEWIPFSGGHEFPPLVIKKFDLFLKGLVS